MGESNTSLVRSCWCPTPALAPFSDDYRVCTSCGTLVSQFEHDRDVARVSSDESDLYGKDYWFGHMEKDLGFTNIFERARTDLSERCLYWLRTLLNYRTPPARVLELGSAHGGFVAALSWAGFEASGLELSPSIAQIARDLYGVDMLVGPIEDQALPAHSFDVIALMDVLEHLPNPVATVRRCVGLLKRGGVLLIQTPEFPEQSFEELTRTGNRFVEMLKPQEHLYLYSQRSVRQLFAQVGFQHLAFERALFSHYDMFFVVSDAPISRLEPSASEAPLLSRPGGRLVRALLDLQERIDASVPRPVFETSEADREARLRVIEQQGDELGAAAALHASLRGDIEGLRSALQASESDREARLRTIEEQAAHSRHLDERREALEAELASARASLAHSEADREARLRVIESQGQELDQAARVRDGLKAELEQLRQRYKHCDEERLANLRVVEQQERALKSVHQQVAGLQEELQTLRTQQDAAQADLRDALAHVDRQTFELRALADALAASGTKVNKLEELNKEMEQLINQGIFQLIIDRLRGRT